MKIKGVKYYHSKYISFTAYYYLFLKKTDIVFIYLSFCVFIFLFFYICIFGLKSEKYNFFLKKLARFVHLIGPV